MSATPIISVMLLDDPPEVLRWDKDGQSMFAVQGQAILELHGQITGIVPVQIEMSVNMADEISDKVGQLLLDDEWIEEMGL